MNRKCNANPHSLVIFSLLIQDKHLEAHPSKRLGFLSLTACLEVRPPQLKADPVFQVRKSAKALTTHCFDKSETVYQVIGHEVCGRSTSSRRSFRIWGWMEMKRRGARRDGLAVEFGGWMRNGGLWGNRPALAMCSGLLW